MATTVTQSTFLSQYNDDFRDSDHYHRILFNNGRALQARELTQMQTIIQSEVGRIGKFLFEEAGLFNTSYGALSAGFAPVGFLKVTSLPVGYDLLVGAKINNSAGITATVKAVIPATGSDAATLLIKYISSNGLVADSTENPKGFEAGNVITYTGSINGTLSIQTTNTVINPAIGKGSMIEVPSFDTFVANHIVFVEAQKLVISKYNSKPTDTIGFVLTEQVITASDNIALYDNSGTTPNLTSPGADRYKITLTLSKLSDINDSQTFYPVYKIINGSVRLLKTADNVLSRMGDILSSRTNDISGNFIVQDAQQGKFNLNVIADSDTDYIRYKLDGGIAFVNGSRISIPSDTSTLRILKPRDLTVDILSVSNEFVNASYGNYILANSLKGLVGGIATLAPVNLYDGVNHSGTILGTARIINIDEVDGYYRIYLFDVNMNVQGNGREYNIRDVSSVGTGAANYANLASVYGKIDIYDKTDATLCFPVSKDRVQEISSVTMPIRKIYSGVTNGSGEVTLTTGSTNLFTDQENWILSVDADGEVFSPPSISGSVNTSVTITGLPTTTAVTLLAQEAKSAVLRIKTLTNRTESGITMSGSSFLLSRSDIYGIESITDDITLKEISYKFILDNGQRDMYYAMGGGTLRNGAEAPAGTISVVYKYLAHSSGDYFGGKPSYPDISYESVPTYLTSTGRAYRLTDVIDMRSTKNTTNAGFTGTGSVLINVPKSSGLITAGVVKYWEPRIDIIHLTHKGDITVTAGSTSHNFPYPSIPTEDMELYNIILNPYVLDKTDLDIVKINNQGYKMSDIRALDNRIKNLESISALTLSEIDLLGKTVQDPTDATLPDRVKLGITGDTFTTNLQSHVMSDDYRARINTTNGTLGPVAFGRKVSLHYDSDQSIGTILKGGTIWPKYSEEVMINQNVASYDTNVNQFEINKAVGSGNIEPSSDNWSIKKLQTLNGSFNLTLLTSSSMTSQGDEQNYGVK